MHVRYSRSKIGDDAERAAYLGAFHAEQAFIFERTGKVAKTHNGVHSQFLKLARDQARIPVELRRLLKEAYNLETVADYEILGSWVSATGPPRARRQQPSRRHNWPPRNRIGIRPPLPSLPGPPAHAISAGSPQGGGLACLPSLF